MTGFATSITSLHSLTVIKLDHMRNILRLVKFLQKLIPTELYVRNGLQSAHILNFRQSLRNLRLFQCVICSPPVCSVKQTRGTRVIFDRACQGRFPLRIIFLRIERKIKSFLSNNDISFALVTLYRRKFPVCSSE